MQRTLPHACMHYTCTSTHIHTSASPPQLRVPLPSCQAAFAKQLRATPDTHSAPPYRTVPYVPSPLAADSDTMVPQPRGASSLGPPARRRDETHAVSRDEVGCLVAGHERGVAASDIACRMPQAPGVCTDGQGLNSSRMRYAMRPRWRSQEGGRGARHGRPAGLAGLAGLAQRQRGKGG